MTPLKHRLRRFSRLRSAYYLGGELRNIAHAGLDEAALWRPVLSEVRKLPGFKDLVRSEGLVDYWRAYGWPDVCRPTAGEDFECT